MRRLVALFFWLNSFLTYMPSTHASTYPPLELTPWAIESEKKLEADFLRSPQPAEVRVFDMPADADPHLGLTLDLNEAGALRLLYDKKGVAIPFQTLALETGNTLLKTLVKFNGAPLAYIDMSVDQADHVIQLYGLRSTSYMDIWGKSYNVLVGDPERCFATL